MSAFAVLQKDEKNRSAELTLSGEWLIKEHPDTFLEERMAAVLRKDTKGDYEGMRVYLKFFPDDEIALEGGNHMTNIRFERRGM